MYCGAKKSRHSFWVALIFNLILISSASHGQIGGSGGGAVPQAVCASNAGEFTTGVSIRTPDGASLLSFVYSSATSTWGFNTPTVTSLNGTLTAREPGGCTETLMIASQNPMTYVTARGSRYDRPGSILREVSLDGDFLQFIQVIPGLFVPHKTVSVTGWYNEYLWSGSTLTGLKVGRHAANGERYIFHVAISRNAQGEVTKVEVKNGEQTAVVRTYTFVWRTINGLRALASVIDRGRDGLGNDATNFSYRLIGGKNYLMQVTDALLGGSVRIVYAQQAVPNGAARVVVSGVMRSNPPGPDLDTRYTYEGGVYGGGYFLGFNRINTTDGRLKNSTFFDVSSVEKAALVTGTESTELSSGRVLGMTSSFYEYGGPQGKVAALKESASSVVGPTGVMKFFKNLFYNNFTTGRVTKVENLGQEPLSGATPASAVDNSTTEYAYEPCHAGASALCTRMREIRSYLADGSLFGRTVYGYDANGNLTTTRQIEANNSSYLTTRVPDAYGNTVEVFSDGGSRLRYAYDQNGYQVKQVTDLTHTENNATTTAYDPDTKLVTSVTGRFGDRSNFSYDNRYALITSTNQDVTGSAVSNSTTTMTFGGAGPSGTNNLVMSGGTYSPESGSWLSGAGASIGSFTKTADGSYLNAMRNFDRYGQVSKETYPFGSASNSYSPTDMARPGTNFTYDVLGRLIAETHDTPGNGITNAMHQYGTAVGPDGEVDPTSKVSLEGPDVTKTASSYNTSTVINGSGQSTTSRTTSRLGNMVEVKDSKGNLISRERFDFLGRLLSSEDGQTATATYEYPAVDPNTNVRVAIERKGASYKETRTHAGKVIRLILGDSADPDRQDIAYTYNAKNQLEQVANIATSNPGTGAGHYKRFIYNQKNEVVETQEGFASDGASPVVCNYTYNDKGQVASFETRNSATSKVIFEYYYDPRTGELASIKSPNLAAPNYNGGPSVPGTAAFWKYSDDGLQAQVTKPRSKTREICEFYPISYALKSCQLFNYVTNEVLNSISFTYDPTDPNKYTEHSKNQKWGETIETVVETNPLGDPTKVYERGQKGEMETTFTYNDLGNVETETRTQLTTSETKTYQYGWDPNKPYQLARTVVSSDPANPLINTYNQDGSQTTYSDEQGHITWRRLTNQGQVLEYKVFSNASSTQPYQHVFLTPGATNLYDYVRRVFHTPGGERVRRTEYCSGQVEIVETIENQSGAVLDKNMFVHAFGPNVANDASIKVATLTYVLAGTLRAVFDRDEFPADPKTNWTYENSPNNDGAAPPNANNNQGTQTEVPEVPGGGGGEPSTEQPAQESGYTCFFPPDLQKKKEEDKANDSPGVVCAYPVWALPSASAMLAPGSNPAEQGNTAQNNSTCGPSDEPCGSNYPDNKPWCTDPGKDGNGDEPEEKKEKLDDKCAPHEVLVDGECVSKYKVARGFCQELLGLTGQDANECQKTMMGLFNKDNNSLLAPGGDDLVKKVINLMDQVAAAKRALRESFDAFAQGNLSTHNLRLKNGMDYFTRVEEEIENLMKTLDDVNPDGLTRAQENAFKKIQNLKDTVNRAKNILNAMLAVPADSWAKLAKDSSWYGSRDRTRDRPYNFTPAAGDQKTLWDSVRNGTFKGKPFAGYGTKKTAAMAVEHAERLEKLLGIKIDPTRISHVSATKGTAEVHWWRYEDSDNMLDINFGFHITN